jgi:hypothetical protein
LTGAPGIPEASRLSTTASGILDRPVKPGDDGRTKLSQGAKQK